MKIDFGHGLYLEPDEARGGPFHKRIVGARPLANTKSGNVIDLECGHRAMTFGDLRESAGVVLCTQCRDRAKGEHAQ